ncbi:MAG TPA: hypothetical protein PLP29_18535 [Candidatus Ozemobacteraceae bacterium]|nr:hypothetical protein [Candidatus Ozemobacteraceae bacterium]
MKINDPDVRLLVGISKALEAEYSSGEDEWLGSPFAWIKTRPSRQVGAIGEKLIAGWLAARGFNVTRSSDSDADRIIEGLRVEIKFSTRWATGVYKFQQLRDQKYDIALCLGVSPFDAHCWVIPKQDILRLWKVEGIISNQHGGMNGTDTAWIDVNPRDIPHWLHEYGGSLASAIQKISDKTGYRPQPIIDEGE